MLMIGCDFHPGFQQVAIFDKRRGEIEEKRLALRQEAEAFYRSLAGETVLVGMEACGNEPAEIPVLRGTIEPSPSVGFDPHLVRSRFAGCFERIMKRR